jgi:hypothetical protein
MAGTRSPVPGDHRVTLSTIFGIMAVTFVIAFLLMSILRAPKAW